MFQLFHWSFAISPYEIRTVLRPRIVQDWESHPTISATFFRFRKKDNDSHRLLHSVPDMYRSHYKTTMTRYGIHMLKSHASCIRTTMQTCTKNWATTEAPPGDLQSFCAIYCHGCEKPHLRPKDRKSSQATTAC